MGLSCSLDDRFLNECDSVLIASSHSYEEASLIQVKSWLKSLPQNPSVYAIGPLLPSRYGRHSVEGSESKGQVESDVQAFLKEMQSKYGENSVVFVGFPLMNTSHVHGNFQISFGTNCWPTVPEYIDEVIRALTEKEVPFVHFFLPYIFVDPFTFSVYSDT